ncbi:hypothetical protein C8R46DRAFT_1220973 [Mycena filopes]|nr:hypothetical protein C8R46DRAFT_1220973 [Mycena filopes]
MRLLAFVSTALASLALANALSVAPQRPRAHQAHWKLNAPSAYGSTGNIEHQLVERGDGLGTLLSLVFSLVNEPSLTGGLSLTVVVSLVNSLVATLPLGTVLTGLDPGLCPAPSAPAAGGLTSDVGGLVNTATGAAVPGAGGLRGDGVVVAAGAAGSTAGGAAVGALNAPKGPGVAAVDTAVPDTPAGEAPTVDRADRK